MMLKNMTRQFSEKHIENLRLSHIGKSSRGRGFSVSEETKQKISESLRGHKLSSETKNKMKGRKAWNNGLRGIQIAWNKGLKGFMKGRKMPIESRLKMSIDRRGTKGSNWKGGVTPINSTVRKSVEYKLWRTSVFTRDNFACVWCGKKDKTIQADHIKPFSLFPELRFAIDNGRTLCQECHKTTETYGKNIK